MNNDGVSMKFHNYCIAFVFFFDRNASIKIKKIMYFSWSVENIKFNEIIERI